MTAKLITRTLATILTVFAVLVSGQVAGAYAQDLIARPAVAAGAGLSDGGFLVLMALCVAFAALLGMVVTMWVVVGRSTASLRRAGPDLSGWPPSLAVPYRAI